jgi:ubiquinone/menaquinone biosynthesis C-methylase UbiE
VIEMARLVGKTGRVVGVDSSQVMVAEARRRSEGLPADIVVGDAENLEFPARTFDACRSERAFMYLDAGRALDEMIRVTKPGGRLVVFDVDHDGISIDSPRPAVTRKMVQFLSDNHRNGIVGRQLKRFFMERGLIDISFKPHSHVLPFSFFKRLCSGSVIKAQEAGVITKSDGEQWLNELADADKRGFFLMVVPGFIVGGRKP